MIDNFTIAKIPNAAIIKFDLNKLKWINFEHI